MENLEPKARLHVPCLYECQLPIGSRLVLSYLDYQSKYNIVPDDAQTHRATGLSRDKIRSVKAELLNDGWWDGTVVTPKFRQFTRRAENKYGYQFFRCYVHQPGQSQSVASVAMWSLIYTMLTSPKKPSMTYRYFSTALGLGNGTAQNCVTALVDGGWLAVTNTNGVLSFKLYRLGPDQLACLRDKAEFRPESSSEIVLEDAPILFNNKMSNGIMCVPIEEDRQNAIHNAIERIRRHPITPPDLRNDISRFRPWAAAMLKQAGCPRDGWEARLDSLLTGDACRSGCVAVDTRLAPQ